MDEMSIRINDIPVSELFKDLQVTLAEIELCRLAIDQGHDYTARLNSNFNIRDAIIGIIKSRFSTGEIINFLEHGYPRATVIESTF